MSPLRSAVAALCFFPVSALADPPIPVAVFPFTINDTSGVAAPGQAERLAAATDLLRATLLATGRYKPVDLSPYAKEMAALQPPDECGECWAKLARKAGARQEILPNVQKVSVLISAMEFWIADVDTMKYIKHVSGQIRGDTTEAYTRGIDFLVNKEIMKKS